MGNQTGSTDQKSTATSINAKTDEKRNMREREEKDNKKQMIKLEEIHQKVLAKEGRLKRYRDRIQKYGQNRTFQTNEKKFYQQIGGECTKTYQQSHAREAKLFLSKIWERGDNNRKAEWINNVEKQLQGHEEKPKAKTHIDSLRATLKKYRIGKHQVMKKLWNMKVAMTPIVVKV